MRKKTGEVRGKWWGNSGENMVGGTREKHGGYEVKKAGKLRGKGEMRKKGQRKRGEKQQGELRRKR